MKLHNQATNAFYNTFTAYGTGYVEVNEKRFEHSLIVLPEGVTEPWSARSFEGLSPADFAVIVSHRPELVIFGSGARLRFPPPAVLRPLLEARIGFETMDTQAACRTYNVLMSEGRRVACAILIEAAADSSR